MSIKLKKYVLAAKPWITLSNLLSSAGGFLLASRGRVDIPALLSTTLSISFVVASGCVFNNYLDRDLDQIMVRTRNRPLAEGAISPRAALFYASSLGIAGMSLLLALANGLTAVVVLAGFTTYVGLYSLYLKRKTIHAALLGSLAGSAPPLAGYCAVTNHFDLGAILLVTIFSLWQMPHCYAISIYRREDYAAAAIPTLPEKYGVIAARRHIIGHILSLMAATLMLTLSGYTGYTTLAVATTLNLSWLYTAWRDYGQSEDRVWAKKLYVISVLSIFVLTAMMSIDSAGPR